MNRSLIAIPIASIALLANACSAAVDGSKPTPVAVQHTLAELQLGDSHLRFEQLAGSQLAVVEDRPRGTKSLLAEPALQALNVVEKYERLAHEPAPAELVSAFQRAVLAAEELDDSDREPPERAEAAAPPVEALHSALLAEDFQTQFCGEHANTYCLLNQSSDQTLTQRAWYLGANVDADRGDFNVELRLDRWAGGWDSQGTWPIKEGQILYFYLDWNGQSRRKMAIRFHDTAGDNYHVSAWFNN
jgi:hypothetical protein